VPTTSKSARLEAAAAAIARATGFRVVRFVGRGKYEDLGTYPTL